MKKALVILTGFVLGVLGFISVAHAGVMEVIKTLVKSDQIWVGIVTVVLLYVLKRIPNESIQLVIGKIAYGIGVTITLGLSKYKFTAPFWKAYIEPYFIDLFNNTVGTFVTKFIEGLRSDNNGNVS